MKKISFDFIKDMQLKEIEKSPLAVSGIKLPAENADFRLHSDGSIYPSQAIVESDCLEFQPKGSDILENGYDVFLSSDWVQYVNESADSQPFVCIARVSKHEPKVDLFSTCKRDKDGNPKSSVFDQKTKSGEKLISLLEQVYLENEATLFADKTYVDLRIVKNQPLKKTKTGIYNLPKPIARGKDAGKESYVRRENIQVYALELVQDNSTVKTTEAGILDKNEANALFNAD